MFFDYSCAIINELAFSDSALDRHRRRKPMSDIVSETKIVKIPGKPLKIPSPKLPWPRMSEPDENGKIAPLGIDIEAKRQDIIRLVHKFFKVEGISMDELLQEVYVAIIHKNTTRSAHDPRKSSFGHYVYLVSDHVCINLVHKQKRHSKESESLDAPCGEEQRTLLETIEISSVEPEPEQVTEKLEDFESRMRRNGLWDQARYVRAVRSGVSPDIVREALTWGDRKISSKTIRDIRNRVKDAFAELKCA